MARYIDADALAKYINSLSTHPLNEWDTQGVLMAIDKQPTADVVDKEKYDRLLENSIIIAEALNKYQTADVVEVV